MKKAQVTIWVLLGDSEHRLRVGNGTGKPRGTQIPNPAGYVPYNPRVGKAGLPVCWGMGWGYPELVVCKYIEILHEVHIKNTLSK